MTDGAAPTSEMPPIVNSPSGAARAEASGAKAGRALIWAALLTVGALTLAPVVRFVSVSLTDNALAQSTDAIAKQKVGSPLPTSASADYFETLGELALQVRPADLGAARRADQKAVQLDPSRAFAWAGLSYLDYKQAGRVTPEGLKALAASFRACPYCDQDLVRWRFNFVLANWPDMPEELRRRAFDSADILRWTGDSAEFLGGMKIKARASAIPFDTYRAQVKTPYRASDLAPAPAAKSPS